MKILVHRSKIFKGQNFYDITPWAKPTELTTQYLILNEEAWKIGNPKRVFPPASAIDRYNGGNLVVCLFYYPLFTQWSGRGS